MAEADRSTLGSSRRLGAVVLGAALFAAACTSSGSDATSQTSGGTDDAAAEVDEQTDGDTEQSGDEGAGASQTVESIVSPLAGGSTVAADLNGPEAPMVTLQDEPFVGIARLPTPDYEGNPWSHWGQGALLDDGRLLIAAGDHLGEGGNSYLFIYDPELGTVVRFSDVASALGNEPGSWGYGKVHGQMVDPGDGGIWFSTYYGSRRNLEFGGGYEGDVLFRIDKATLEVTPIAVPVPLHGVPSLATNGNGLIYGEAVDPLLPDDLYPGGGFFVYDVESGETEFFTDPAHTEFRNVMVADDGTAFFARGTGLFKYDPATGDVSESDVELAADLRASTRPLADGTILAVTAEPFEMFSFAPDGTVSTLGEAIWYPASLALTPDESAFLYVPDAHGDSWIWESPLIAVDVETGDETTIVELLELVRDEIGITLGGTYSVVVDAERSVAYLTFNAGPDEDTTFDEVVLVAVELS